MMARERLALVILCLAPLAGVGPAHAAARSADVGGVATLSGQAFLTARGGEAVTCAGREVTALPDGPADSARSTLCDSQGHFVFTGLAPRDWTIRASIRWDVRAKQSIRHLGGDVVQHVALSAGDNRVVLNDRDLTPQPLETPRMAATAP